MALTRRRFLSNSTALGVSTAAAPLAAPALAAQAQPGSPAPAQTQTVPPIEVIAMQRLAYGPRPGDFDRVRTMGFAAYVEEQLNPNDADDPANERIAQALLKIEYGAGEGYPAVKEDRPLQHLGKSVQELWKLQDGSMKTPYEERRRPLDEVRAATWIRAVYSKWQLREVLVEFWHNHFNVDGFVDEKITSTWPAYDQIMRKHALGNFRAFIEDVAKSVAMQYYLDNYLSKDGPANENYAREMFELHTLGAPHYLNNLYNRWREVPGALEGKPSGYIDEDVYEAARAFTGWTIAAGQQSDGIRFPNTGAFYYHDRWHDNAQKRVLATELPPNQPPLVDGQQVLNLVANHPGTATYICTKLCQRLVSDTPSAALVQQAAATWIAAAAAPDQIKQVVRVILLSSEFAATWGGKVKRPVELVAGFLRATDTDFTFNPDLNGQIGEMGYRMFSYSAPTGHPDEAGYWLSTNVMLRRWNVLLSIATNSLKIGNYDPRSKTPANATSRQIVEFWVNRLTGQAVPADVLKELIDFLRGTGDADSPPSGNPDELKARVGNLVALIGMLPEFNWR